MVKGLRMFLNGIGERGSSFHVPFDVLEDTLEGLVVLLISQYFKALDQWQASIDEGGKLPDKNHQFSFGDSGLEEWKIFEQVLGLGLEARDGDALPDHELTRNGGIVRFHLAALPFPLPILPLPDIDWHEESSPLIFG